MTNEIVRQLLEQGGMYSLEKPIGDMRYVSDVRYTAAMATPGGGKNDVPHRLKRQFACFYVPPPSADAVNAIFGRLVDGRCAVLRFFCFCLFCLFARVCLCICWACSLRLAVSLWLCIAVYLYFLRARERVGKILVDDNSYTSTQKLEGARQPHARVLPLCSSHAHTHAVCGRARVFVC